jgi:hypothetical protein
MLTHRLIAVPEDPDHLPALPWWTLYSTLIMISIVAGVSEEGGFRGYMQGPGRGSLWTDHGSYSSEIGFELEGGRPKFIP